MTASALTPEQSCRITDRPYKPTKPGAVITGYGTISCSTTLLTLNGEPVTNTSFPVKIDSEGYLTHLRRGQTVPDRFVDVLAGNAPGVNPVGATYHVRIHVFEDNELVALREFDIVAPVGTTVYLTDVAPVAASNGVAITRGATGAKGDPGTPGQIGPAGMQWRGLWSADTDYLDSDAVFYEGNSWFAADDPPLGEIPSAESVYWNALSVQGAPGPAGPAGASVKGDPGPAGPANTLTLDFNEVEPGMPSTGAITGVAPNQTLHLNIARGADGDPGTGGGGSAVQSTGWLAPHSFNSATGYSAQAIRFRRESDRVELLILGIKMPVGMDGANGTTIFQWTTGLGWRAAGDYGEVTGVNVKDYLNLRGSFKYGYRNNGNTTQVWAWDETADINDRTQTAGTNLRIEYNTWEPFPTQDQIDQTGAPSSLPQSQ